MKNIKNFFSKNTLLLQVKTSALKRKMLAKNKRFYCKHKVLLIVLLILLAAIGGPFIIDKAYDASNKIFFTQWDAQNILSYYGTLLGAAATIVAVVLTIRYAQKSSQEDRRHSEKINHRNIGTQVCFELIDACEISRIEDAVFEIKVTIIQSHDKIAENIYLLKINNIVTKINATALKFDVMYPNLRKDDSKKIHKFLDAYTKLILELGISINVNSGRVEIDDSKVLEIIEFYDNSYYVFAEHLQDIIFNYDLTKNKN